jgi:hypothetical protein
VVVADWSDIFRLARGRAEASEAEAAPFPSPFCSSAVVVAVPGAASPRRAAVLAVGLLRPEGWLARGAASLAGSLAAADLGRIFAPRPFRRGAGIAKVAVTVFFFLRHG